MEPGRDAVRGVCGRAPQAQLAAPQFTSGGAALLTACEPGELLCLLAVNLATSVWK